MQPVELNSRARVGQALRHFLPGLALIMLLAGCSSAPPARDASPGEAVLRVAVSGIRNDHGHVISALFAGPAGFPNDTATALQVQWAEIRAGQAELIFAGLVPGSYAVSVMHDENDDGRMNTNWMGMPQEGFGLSGQPRYRFGMPGYREAEIEVPAQGRELVIRLRYQTGRRETRDELRSGAAGKPTE